jgi:hypothetical protein
MWRARFGRGFGPVVRQTAKWMDGSFNQFYSSYLYYFIASSSQVYSCNVFGDLNASKYIRNIGKKRGFQRSKATN